MLNEIPKGVINPFSDAFTETWKLWKAYLQESHDFVYRGVISEQMALKRLVEVSGGEEEKAIRIVNQSIMRQWKDFFELRQPSFKNGERPTSKKRTEPKEQPSSLRERVQRAVNKKYGGGNDYGSESHLKAV